MVSHEADYGYDTHALQSGVVSDAHFYAKIYNPKTQQYVRVPINPAGLAAMKRQIQLYGNNKKFGQKPSAILSPHILVYASSSIQFGKTASDIGDIGTETVILQSNIPNQEGKKIGIAVPLAAILSVYAATYGVDLLQSMRESEFLKFTENIGKFAGGISYEEFLKRAQEHGLENTLQTAPEMHIH